MPLLSVVVPVHNVERYLAACLDSLRMQSLADLEVVLVDDGSTDRSTAIAEDFCARDPRFRLVRQENAGAGPARNRGVEHATGEYLAFVDSDDLTHRRMYELLVGSLQRSGSDFAVSRASRFSNLGQTPSMLHELAMSEPATGTHIDRRPELVLDRMIWNTVYRRSFWDRAGEDGGPLRYRAMMLQDYPVSLEAHLAAAAVDVLSECLYYWRERDGGDLSLTQRSNELAHVVDRFTSANLVLDLAEPRIPASLPILRRHLLEVDVHAITGAMTTMTGADRATALDLARRLVERLGPEAGANSPAFYKVQAAMVEAGRDDLLTELHAYAHEHGKTAPVEARGWPRKRWYEAFPGFGGLPLPPYERKGGRPVPAPRVVDAAWTADDRLELVLELDGVARRPRVEAWLVDGERRVVCPVGPHDGTRRRVLVTPAALAADGKVAPGFRPLRLRVDDVEVSVAGPMPGRTRYLPTGSGPNGSAVRPHVRGADGFGLAFGRPWAEVDEIRADGGTLHLAGAVRLGSHADVLTVGDRSYPVTTDRGRFAVSVPAEHLVDAPDHQAHLDIQTSFPVRLRVDGEARVVVVPAGVRAAAAYVGRRMLVATRGVAGVLELVEARVAPVLTELVRTGPTTLRFAGEWGGPEPLPARVLLEHFEHPGEETAVEVPLDADGHRYAFEVDLAAVGGRGPWHLLLPFPDHLAPQVVDRTAVATFPAEMLELGRNDVVRLAIGSPT